MNQDGRFEPWTAVCGVVAAGLEIYRRFFIQSISEQEQNDLYAKQKTILEMARVRLKRERSNLVKLAADAQAQAGDEYTETTPFELMQQDFRRVYDIRWHRRLIDQILVECQRNLELPSGQKDVSRLIPLLKKLDAKLCKELNEARVWQ